MAVITHHTLGARSGALGLFSRIIGALAAWNDTRKTREALHDLPDRLLDDVGLTRSDIDAVVNQQR